MTQPNAEGKVKPFPFEFCLWGNILSKGVAYTTLQLNTVNTHSHTHRNLLKHSYKSIHFAMWPMNSFKSKGSMRYMRGIKRINRDTDGLLELSDTCLFSLWTGKLYICWVTSMCVYSAYCWSLKDQAVLMWGYLTSHELVRLHRFELRRWMLHGCL